MRRFIENRILTRIGPVMEKSLIHIAINGPTFPWEIHEAIDASDAAVYKAVRRMHEWGWLERVKDPTHLSPTNVGGQRAYRHYYKVTPRGWEELESHLIPKGQWTRELMRRREEARRRTRSAPAVAHPR